MESDEYDDPLHPFDYDDPAMDSLPSILPPSLLRPPPRPLRPQPPSQPRINRPRQPKHPVVNPNPFIHPKPVHHPRQADNSAMLEPDHDQEDDDEDMPIIHLNEGGEYVAQPAAGPSRPSLLVKKGQNGQIGQNGAATRELEALRTLNANVLADNVKLNELVKTQLKELRAKQGEIQIVRSRFDKIEADHKKLTEIERAAMRKLELSLETRDKEHRATVEMHKTEIAFQRQEAETSRRGPSQWPSSSARPRQSTGRRDNIALPLFPAPSPSMHRTRGKTPARSALHLQRQMSSPEHAPIPGFVNSFAEPTTPFGGGKGKAREMAPPKGKRLQRTPDKNGAAGSTGTSSGKVKGRMMLEGDEEEGENEESETWPTSEMELDGEEGIETEDDLMSRAPVDGRAEILSAILKHTTFVHFDLEASVVLEPGATADGSLTGRSSLHAPSNRAASNATLNPAVKNARDPEPDAPPQYPSPTPTFYTLTNLRFPPSTPASLIASYAELSRVLFVDLGKRSRSYNDEKDALGFAFDISRQLEGMARLLALAGLVGPLISLFSLISSLVLLFPGFSLVFLNHPRLALSLPPSHVDTPSTLLPLLSSIIARYGRPAPPIPIVRPTRGKGRRKGNQNRLALLAREELSKGREELIELGMVKREALLTVVLELLQGLVWAVDEGGEESFVGVLEGKDVVATLLDPAQPLGILTASVQLLSLFASRKGLFRTIMSVQFYDAADVRGAKIPFLDRLGTLLAQKRSAPSYALQTFAFHTSLLSLLTILTTQHADAMLFLSSSTSLIPELVGCIFNDTRSIWDQDGQSLSLATRNSLSSVVKRLGAAIALFHCLSTAPHSSLKIAEFCMSSSFVGLGDRLVVAFGTICYAGVPEWAVGSDEANRLVELGYLAQDVMEDINPSEADDIELCFLPPQPEGEGQPRPGDAGDEEEEMAARRYVD